MNDKHKEYLKKLAAAAVEKGVNIQKGQPLLVRADIEQKDLVREITKRAYEKGASEVLVDWSDGIIDKERMLHAQEVLFDQAPAARVALYEYAAKNNGAFLSLTGTDPDLYKECDPSRSTRASKAFQQAAKYYREGIDQGKLSWCVIAAPTQAWAKKVHPEQEPEAALEALWDDVFAVSRIDDGDPLENWTRHDASFENRLEKLNGVKIKKLHYKNSKGTDLEVLLPEGYRFEGGSSTLSDGRLINCNIPTEEVFTAPMKTGVNGTLTATMPLSSNGKLVDDFGFRFENGQVVDYWAKQGKEVLDQLIGADEGARYLGEAALVSQDSPIRQRGVLFYNTLLDENASCHFALGQSYAETIKNGLEMSEEQLLEKGMNQSSIHVDFMVGSDDLQVEGTLEDGTVIPILVNGRFSSWFDPVSKNGTID